MTILIIKSGYTDTILFKNNVSTIKLGLQSRDRMPREKYKSTLDTNKVLYIRTLSKNFQRIEIALNRGISERSYNIKFQAS